MGPKDFRCDSQRDRPWSRHRAAFIINGRTARLFTATHRDDIHTFLRTRLAPSGTDPKYSAISAVTNVFGHGLH